jgi:hypothetical protein
MAEKPLSILHLLSSILVLIFASSSRLRAFVVAWIYRRYFPYCYNRSIGSMEAVANTGVSADAASRSTSKARDDDDFTNGDDYRGVQRDRP